MKIKLSEKDFRKAGLIIERERISPIDIENLFRAGLYSILSSSENHKKHTLLYNELLYKSLDTPDEILERTNDFHNVIKKSRFPRNKERHILGFSEFWKSSDVPHEILMTASDGMEEGMHLRDIIAKEAPGMGLKCASFFMQKCGCDDTVMVDIWVQRFLKDSGYDIILPDYKAVSGMKARDYRKYEKIVSDMAQIYDVTPVLMQAAVWQKYSPFAGIYEQTDLSMFGMGSYL